MKILHILSQIPEATGSGIYLQAAMRHAAQCGYQNYLLSGVSADFSEGEQLQSTDYQDHCFVRFDQDLPFPVVGMSDVMPYPSARFCDLSKQQLHLYEECFEKKLAHAVQSWQPDLIHSHHLWLLTSLVRQRYPDIPLLASCHGTDLRQFQNCTHLQAAVLKGCSQIDSICALSLAQKKEIQHLYGIDPKRIHIVGNGYDNRRFYQAKRKKQADQIHILYAGKLSHAKGVPWLLQALEDLPAEEFVLHLAGDGHGDECDKILALAKRLGKKIIIHGKLKQQRLADLMRQVDVFVLPSFFEGLPLVLLEALASGCRIIATNLPGVSELFGQIESDWIELVRLPEMATIDSPRTEAEALFVTDLQKALQSQQQRIRTKEQNSCQPQEILELLNHHTWEKIFLKIEQQYQQLTCES